MKGHMDLENTPPLSGMASEGSRLDTLNPVADCQVAILLCTFNGQTYLPEQLASFTHQTYANWQLWVSDDGSKDTTLSILEHYQSSLRPGQTRITAGPRQGFAMNFLSLVCACDGQADYYAYADQDDIWHADKIEHALRWLQTVPHHQPALYCTRSELIDSVGQHVGFSKAWPRSPSFQNALTQNIGGGNTMVFNRAARQLLVQAGADVGVVAHDWWTYLLVTACGGQVCFDTTPTLQYRQHQNNAIGANHDLTAPLRSVGRLLQGHFKQWTTHHIAALGRPGITLTLDNQRILQTFSQARQKHLFGRAYGVYKSGIYRQTRLGNMGLMLGTLLGRI